MTVTPIEEVRPDERQSIKQRAQAAALEIGTGERVVKAACLELFNIEQDFYKAGGVMEQTPQGLIAFTLTDDPDSPSGFYAWLKYVGLEKSNGSIHNYLCAGRAIHDGLDPDGDSAMTHLYNLGAMLRRGKSPQALEGLTPEAARRKNEADKDGGLVKIKIPEVYAAEADVVAERIIKLGLAPSRPEAIGLALIAVSTLDETEFRTLLERQTGGE